MSLIVLKVPRSKRKVKYIRSAELIEKEKREREIRLKPLLEPEPEPEIIEEVIEEIPEVIAEPEPEPEVKPLYTKRTVYSEEFTIVDSEKPIEISLKNIPDDSISIMEFEKEVQSAYDKGFQDGADSSQVTLQTEIQKNYEYIRNIDKITDELRSEYHKSMKTFEDSLISMSILVAQHILEREISVSTEVVVDQVKKALDSLDEETVFKIHIHPDNFMILKEAKSTLTADSSKTENVTLIANKTVDRGGCLLETSAGMVDARIRTQLEKLEQSIREAASQINDTDYLLDNTYEVNDDNS